MRKTQVGDLSTQTKKIDSPSSDTKKKESQKKQQKTPDQSEMINLQQRQQSSSDQDNLIQGSPPSNIYPKPKMQKLQSQETSNILNPPPQPPKKKKIKGILSSQDDQVKKNVKAAQPVEERKDHFGSTITKGPNKHHRICFNPQIEEVYEVENWKEYNIEEKYGLCSCRCNIFQMTLLAILAM